MKNSEKTAVVRIFVDLIKADRIIDTGEMVFYDEMRKKYNFVQENEVAATTMSFSEAISILKMSAGDLRRDVLADCTDATVSDGFCAHSEALLLIALKRALGDEESENVSVISIPKKSFHNKETNPSSFFLRADCLSKISQNDILSARQWCVYEESSKKFFKNVDFRKVVSSNLW